MVRINDSVLLNVLLLLAYYVFNVNYLFLLDYQPLKREKHSLLKVVDYLYMWGGYQPSLPEVHDTKKKSMSSVMEVCHLPSGRWEQKPILPVLLHWVSLVMQLLLLEMRYSILVDIAVILVAFIIVYLVLMLIPSTGKNSLLLLLTMVLG